MSAWSSRGFGFGTSRISCGQKREIGEKASRSLRATHQQPWLSGNTASPLFPVYFLQAGCYTWQERPKTPKRVHEDELQVATQPAVPLQSTLLRWVKEGDRRSPQVKVRSEIDAHPEQKFESRPSAGSTRVFHSNYVQLQRKQQIKYVPSRERRLRTHLASS